MGSVWSGEDPNQKFYGVVTKRLRYKGRKGKTINGYEVIWDDGEKERWPYEYLVVALVPKEGTLLHSDDDDDSESDSDIESKVEEIDVFDMMMNEREDPEDHE